MGTETAPTGMTGNNGTAPSPRGARTATGSLGSPELSNAIRALMAGRCLGRRPTLADVRNALQTGVTWSEGEIQFPQDRTALVIELDELLDRFGARAWAEDFVAHGK